MTRLPLLALALASLGLLLLALLGQSDLDWNSVRTVIPVAWLGGLSPYTPPPPAGNGPFWANIYPPLGFALQLPAAALAYLGIGPLGTIRAMQLISAAWVIGPLMLIAASATPHARFARALPALPIIAAAVLAAQPLEDAVLLAHIDAPALGLCLLAAFAAARSRPCTAALLTTAAVFTKQTAIGIAPALLLYLLLTRPRQAAAVYLATTAVAAIVALGLCVLAFGVGPFWETVVGVPSRHPLRLGPAAAFAEALPLAGPVAAALIVALPAARLADPAALRRAAPYLALAAGLLPMGLLGFAKFGGGPNNLAFPLVPLLAALLAALPAPPLPAPDSARPSLGRFIVPTLAVPAALVLALHTPRLLRAPSLARTSQHTLAFDLTRQSPGLYYFPWLPLSHYLGERRILHQSWGVLDRMTASPPPPPPLPSILPDPPPVFLAFFRPPDDNDAIFLLLREQYPHRIPHPALPGWYVFVRTTP